MTTKSKRKRKINTLPAPIKICCLEVKPYWPTLCDLPRTLATKGDRGVSATLSTARGGTLELEEGWSQNWYALGIYCFRLAVCQPSCGLKGEAVAVERANALLDLYERLGRKRKGG